MPFFFLNGIATESSSRAGARRLSKSLFVDSIVSARERKMNHGSIYLGVTDVSTGQNGMDPVSSAAAKQ